MLHIFCKIKHSESFAESISFRQNNISCTCESLKWRISLIIFHVHLLKAFLIKNIYEQASLS